MAVMSKLADAAYDLAIVDPPYGIGFSDYERGASGEATMKRYTKTEKKQWDALPPTKEYFEELRRVSKNQIIFGANHFWAGNLPNTPHFVFWNKAQPVKNFAAGELVWTSFQRPAALCDLPYYGNIGSEGVNRTHPTQKPVKLYSWLLENYAKPGDRIIDTHMGSGTTGIACLRTGRNFIGIEKDPEHFATAVERIEREAKQGVLL